MKIKRLVNNVCMLLLLLCVCAGCKNKEKAPMITKVEDILHIDVPILNVTYNHEGDIIQYGNTPIKYKGDQITIGAMDMVESDGKLLEVVFFVGKGRALESRALCILKTKNGDLEVEKKTTYKYRSDSLIIRSDYHAITDQSFVRNVEGKYIFDDKKRIAEAILVYREANDSVYSRYSHYNYDNNLHSKPNLDLQAYIVDHDGADGFFYFLLNLAQISYNGSLPNDIAYSLNPDGETFNLHANYRMVDEKVTRIEVLQENAKLLSRIDFGYKNEKINNEEQENEESKMKNEE